MDATKVDENYNEQNLRYKVDIVARRVRQNSECKYLVGWRVYTAGVDMIKCAKHITAIFATPYEKGRECNGHRKRKI